MRVFPRWLLVGALCGSLASAANMKAEDASALLARLQSAATVNSLDDASLKPWHLKVSYQLFDNKGKPGEQGTMEEWRSSPKLYKLSFTSPSYTSTEIHNQDGVFFTNGAREPYMLTMLQDLMLHPMPQEWMLAQATPKLKKEKFGKQKVELDCITLEPSHFPQMSVGQFRTYCLDDTNRLRLSYDVNTLEAARNTLGVFQQRTVAIDLLVAANGMNLLTAHVTTLQTDPSDAAEFIPTPEMSKESGPRAFHVGSAVVAGQKVSGPPPTYPEGARAQHKSGTVLLSAIIGTDGRIHDLEVISDPDDNLAAAAKEAVQQWVYKPFMLNGAPTEAQTMITVNFRMGY